MRTYRLEVLDDTGDALRLRLREGNRQIADWRADRGQLERLRKAATQDYRLNAPPETLLSLGRELYAWLDGDGRTLAGA